MYIYCTSRVAAGFSQFSKNIPKPFLMYIVYVHVYTYIWVDVCMHMSINSFSLARDILLLEAGFLTILVAPFNLAFWRKYVML